MCFLQAVLHDDSLAPKMQVVGTFLAACLGGDSLGEALVGISVGLCSKAPALAASLPHAGIKSLRVGETEADSCKNYFLQPHSRPGAGA